MKRVIVIGCPGSGKSRFSIALGKITGLPLYHLDMLYWNSDGTTVPREVFISRLKEAVGGDEWIIDGNYASTMEMRMEAADTVIFLDYPTDVCLSGIEKRRGIPRPDMPWVEPLHRADSEFTEFVRRFSEESRPDILKLLEKYNSKKIYVLKSREEGDALLARLARE